MLQLYWLKSSRPWLWLAEAKCILAAVYLVHFNVYLTSYHSIDFRIFPEKIDLWNQLVLIYYVWKAKRVIQRHERLMSSCIQGFSVKISITNALCQSLSNNSNKYCLEQYSANQSMTKHRTGFMMWWRAFGNRWQQFLCNDVLMKRLWEGLYWMKY